MSRGILEVVRSSGLSREVFGMHRLREGIVEALSTLVLTARVCVACGAELGGDVTIVTADLDQAYEACSSAAILEHWPVFERAARERDEHEVRVARGKKAQGSHVRSWGASGLAQA
jgi:hypothetical protein